MIWGQANIPMMPAAANVLLLVKSAMAAHGICTWRVGFVLCKADLTYGDPDAFQLLLFCFFPPSLNQFNHFLDIIITTFLDWCNWVQSVYLQHSSVWRHEDFQDKFPYIASNPNQPTQCRWYPIFQFWGPWIWGVLVVFDIQIFPCHRECKCGFRRLNAMK